MQQLLYSTLLHPPPPSSTLYHSLPLFSTYTCIRIRVYEVYRFLNPIPLLIRVTVLCAKAAITDN